MLALYHKVQSKMMSTNRRRGGAAALAAGATQRACPDGLTQEGGRGKGYRCSSCGRSATNHGVMAVTSSAAFAAVTTIASRSPSCMAHA
eukprot:6461442-Amphidinium_carterae.1